MFTLEDLVNQVNVQGVVNLKVYDEDKEEIESYKSYDFEIDCNVPKEYWNMAITYMYYAADAIQIELKKKDEE